MKRLFLLLLCLSFLLPACAIPTTGGQDVFYYPRSEEEVLDGFFIPEPRELPQDAELTEILNLYCAGPITPGLDHSLPADARIQTWSLDDGVLQLHFSPELAQISGVELTVAASCLAQTFLERCGAHTLSLTAEGALLNGETALELSLADLNLRDNSPDRVHQQFTVYYASSDRRYLIGQEISVQVSSQEELPLQLLEHLLTSPDTRGMRSPLPFGTRIHAVTVADGLCTVDLSQEFESRRFSSLSGQCLSLLSIVNTLTGLPQIQRVEFTIEGNLVIRYGSLSISEPLVQDLRCIGPVRTGLGEQDCVIYLVHGSEELLIPIPTRLRGSTTQSLPELLLQQLLQDPGTNGIRSFISPGTRLRSVTVTDGICYVDLSGEYLNDTAHLRSAGRTIAASLCQFEGIDGVQILVNGQIPQAYDPDLFGILTPNPDWYL